jgi:hypothetical protein
MIIRLLDIHDLDQIRTLLENQKTYFGMDIKDFPSDLSSKISMSNFAKKYLLTDHPLIRCYGSFNDENILTGTICADLFPEMPLWMLRRICIDETLKGTKESSVINQELMATAIDYAETMGYYQHFYLIPVKYRRAHAAMWSKNPKRKNRYRSVDMEIIEANKPPKFRLFWEHLFGRTTYPVDTCVRMSILDNEAR